MAAAKNSGTISIRPRMPAIRKIQRAKLMSRSLLIAVHGVHGKGGEADGDILGALGVRCGVLHPLTGVRYDCLAGVDIELSAAGLHAQRALQHDGEFVELR